MILVSKATKHDLPAIRFLFQEAGKMVITEEHINNRDISLQARDSETGECVGFLWVGLMANGTIGYMDLFTVKQSYAHQGIGQLLAAEAYKQAVKRKIKRVFGLIRQDKWHDQSAMNALKMAIGADQADYTLVYADMAHIISELGIKE